MAPTHGDSADLDALQAQIDLSMAMTEELVASWIRPVHKSSGAGIHQGRNRNLEEYAQRPPRLGVGAGIHSSSQIFDNRSALLKNKLQVNPRKRPREEVWDDSSSTSKQATFDVQERPEKVNQDEAMKTLVLGNHSSKSSIQLTEATINTGSRPVPQSEEVDLQGVSHPSPSPTNTLQDKDGSISKKRKRKRRKRKTDSGLVGPDNSSHTLNSESMRSNMQLAAHETVNDGVHENTSSAKSDIAEDYEDEWTGFNASITDSDEVVVDISTPATEQSVLTAHINSPAAPHDARLSPPVSKRRRKGASQL